ncbi:MAG: type II secretion system F family protein [Verrucomicrobiota bacterium]
MIWISVMGLIGAIAFLALFISKQEADSDKIALRERLTMLSKPQEARQNQANPFSSNIPAALQKPKKDSRRFWAHLTGEATMLRMEKQLAQADIPIRVSEFLMLRIVFVALGMALGIIFLQQWTFAILIGVGMAFIHLPFLSFKRASRIHRFVTQLADFLNLICNSLRAGQTFLQGVDLACRESPAPISVEFRQLLRETNLGMPIDESFSNMYLRVPSEDLKIVLSAFSIQRQVGGNLADILDQVSKTIRERIKIQGQIKVLTTQGKLSGAVVGLLPVVLLVMISFISPDYIKPFFQGDLGKWILGGTVFWQLIGCFVIYKICDIEV